MNSHYLKIFLFILLGGVILAGYGGWCSPDKDSGSSVVIPWADVSTVYTHTLALKSDGSLWAWGSNMFGALGLGDTVMSKTIPTRVGTDNNWAQVRVDGNASTLALKTDGSLWAWGFNNYGQLGLGATTEIYFPTQVNTETNWAKIATVLGGYSFVLKTDGSLWACGENTFGKLGLGDEINRIILTRVGTDTDWAQVTGGGHTLALKTNGTLWAWGWNGDGQLGLGDTISRTTPTRVVTDTDWAQVAGGGYHTLAIKADGTLWAWGDNFYGQLGLGDIISRTTPTRVVTDTDWAQVAGGSYHSLAIKTDGTLWAWGKNFSGQLGLGDTISRTTPTLINTNTNWLKVSAGDSHTIALKTDGTLWAWGDNSNRQLGLGDTINRNTPTQVKQ